jgi:hypothetical protein
MEDTLIAITIGTFGFLLLANIYFRIRTFRTFKQLAEQNIAFSRAHVFDKERMEREIISKHPAHKALIQKHVNSMKASMNISLLCMVVLTICGGVLMYFRS